LTAKTASQRILLQALSIEKEHMAVNHNRNRNRNRNAKEKTMNFAQHVQKQLRGWKIQTSDIS